MNSMMHLFNVKDKAELQKKAQRKKQKKADEEKKRLTQRAKAEADTEAEAADIIEEEFAAKVALLKGSVKLPVNTHEHQTQIEKLGYTFHLNGFGSVLTPEQLKNLTIEESRYYKVIGDQKIFASRDGILSTKLKEIGDRMNPTLKIEEKVPRWKVVEPVKITEGEDLRGLFEFDKYNRYFQLEQKQTIQCRRCKQTGHFERMCLQDARVKCYYCLDEHLSSNCGQKICFSCNSLGHINRDCPQPVSLRCTRCLRVGHKKADCGGIIIQQNAKQFISRNYPSLEDEWKNDDNSKIKCIICSKKGHQNCSDATLNREGLDENGKYIHVYGEEFLKEIRPIKKKSDFSSFAGSIINFNFDDLSEEDSIEQDKIQKSQKKRKDFKSLKNFIPQDEDIQIHVEEKAFIQQPEEKAIPEKKIKEKKPKQIKEIAKKAPKALSKKEQRKIISAPESQETVELVQSSDDENLYSCSEGAFEDKLVMNMIEVDEFSGSGYGSDICLSELNEERDYDYGSDNESQGEYEIRRGKKLRLKKQEDDRKREIAKRQKALKQQVERSHSAKDPYQKQSKKDKQWGNQQEYPSADGYQRNRKQRNSRELQQQQQANSVKGQRKQQSKQQVNQQQVHQRYFQSEHVNNGAAKKTKKILKQQQQQYVNNAGPRGRKPFRQGGVKSKSKINMFC